MCSLPRARSQRGLATVEFTICVPVLLLMMLSTAEIGRLLFQYNTLVKAVRDGARYAVSNAATDGTRTVNLTAQKINETINLVETGNIGGTGTRLLPGDLDVDVADRAPNGVPNGFVTVTATYTYVPMLGSIPTFGLGDGPIDLAMDLSATVVMRAL